MQLLWLSRSPPSHVVRGLHMAGAAFLAKRNPTDVGVFHEIFAPFGAYAPLIVAHAN